jgi:hypothetical protein
MCFVYCSDLLDGNPLWGWMKSKNSQHGLYNKPKSPKRKREIMYACFHLYIYSFNKHGLSKCSIPASAQGTEDRQKRRSWHPTGGLLIIDCSVPGYRRHRWVATKHTGGAYIPSVGVMIMEFLSWKQLGWRLTSSVGFHWPSGQLYSLLTPIALSPCMAVCVPHTAQQQTLDSISHNHTSHPEKIGCAS